MNKTQLVGRLTKNPILKFAQGTGVGICNFTLAVNRRFKRDGQPDADFINIVCFNKQAESVANYMTKGKLVSLAGSISTRNYEAKDGHRVYVTEVIADEVNFLEKKGESISTSEHVNEEYSNNETAEVSEDDIPF